MTDKSIVTRPKLNLRVGDKAKVIANTHNHGFEIGQKVIIRQLYYTGVPPYYRASMFGNPATEWYVNDDEVRRAR